MARLFFVVVFDEFVDFALEAPPLCNRPCDVSRHEIADDTQGEGDAPIEAGQLI